MGLVTVWGVVLGFNSFALLAAFIGHGGWIADALHNSFAVASKASKRSLAPLELQNFVQRWWCKESSISLGYLCYYRHLSYRRKTKLFDNCLGGYRKIE